MHENTKKRGGRDVIYLYHTQKINEQTQKTHTHTQNVKTALIQTQNLVLSWDLLPLNKHCWIISILLKQERLTIKTNHFGMLYGL